MATGQGVLGNNMFTYCLNNPVVHLDASGTRVVGIGFQGEIQGGGTSTGIEIVIYFDEEVCDGDDFLVVVYFYGGYELSPAQLKGILKSADAILLAYSVESAYQRSFTPDSDPTEAMMQFLFETSIVETLRGCISGVAFSGAVFVIDGKEGVFTDPEHYSGEFGTWSYSVDIGTNAASLFVAESQSCTAIGIKTSKKSQV